jgi:hypothetical protein
MNINKFQASSGRLMFLTDQSFNTTGFIVRHVVSAYRRKRTVLIIGFHSPNFCKLKPRFGIRSRRVLDDTNSADSRRSPVNAAVIAEPAKTDETINLEESVINPVGDAGQGGNYFPLSLKTFALHLRLRTDENLNIVSMLSELSFSVGLKCAYPRSASSGVSVLERHRAYGMGLF